MDTGEQVTNQSRSGVGKSRLSGGFDSRLANHRQTNEGERMKYHIFIVGAVLIAAAVAVADDALYTASKTYFSWTEERGAVYGSITVDDKEILRWDCDDSNSWDWDGVTVCVSRRFTVMAPICIREPGGQWYAFGGAINCYGGEP